MMYYGNVAKFKTLVCLTKRPITNIVKEQGLSVLNNSVDFSMTKVIKSGHIIVTSHLCSCPWNFIFVPLFCRLKLSEKKTLHFAVICSFPFSALRTTERLICFAYHVKVINWNTNYYMRNIIQEIIDFQGMKFMYFQI